jgi:hypothetical protein
MQTPNRPCTICPIKSQFIKEFSMKHVCPSFIAWVLICLVPATIRACTIFILTDSEHALFCNNEDWSNPESRIWFVPPSDGCIGAVYVGFNDGWAQGGMNTAGLAFDWVAGDIEKWEPEVGLPRVRGNSGQQVLETCSTVEEAIAFYRSHQDLGFFRAKIMLADRSGASVIIGARDGKLSVEKANQCRGFGYGAQTLNKMLDTETKPSATNGSKILQACVQPGEFATKYSNIFDLISGDIFLFEFAKSGVEIRLNLAAELSKGGHYYAIPPIHGQLSQRLKPLRGSMHPSSSVERTRAHMEEFFSYAVQGHLQHGLQKLARIAPDSLNEDESAARDCIVARLKEGKLPQIAIESPLTHDVASIYMDYWRRSLKNVEQSAGDSELFTELKACLDRHGKNGGRFSSLNELTEALGPMLAAEGFHSLRGVTAPYHELMLWKDETTKSYTVELPESAEQVRIVFMSGFVLRGWLGFATCDLRHSSGWTTKESLYCLRDSYDLSSETFRISYLAHEAQHFADAKQFPKLESPELEYRAKLVELSQAENTLTALLDQFTSQSGTERVSPHGFANRWVVRHLAEALFSNSPKSLDAPPWSQKSRHEIRQAALTLLRSNTKTLKELGANQVQRFL